MEIAKFIEWRVGVRTQEKVKVCLRKKQISKCRVEGRHLSKPLIVHRTLSCKSKQQHVWTEPKAEVILFGKFSNMLNGESWRVQSGGGLATNL